MRTKYFLGGVSEAKGAIDEDNRSIRFVVSTSEVDRDGEIVTVDAVAGAIKDFAKNPVCLAAHEHRLSDGRSPVIGSWNTDSFKAYKNRSEMNLVFATTERGEEYWQLYKSKHQRAVSIGFRVINGHEEVKDGKRIYIITKIELYEISCVAVGANSNAVSKAKFSLGWQSSEKDTDNAEIPESVKDYFDSHFDDLKEYIDLQFLQIKDMLVTDPDGLAESMLGKDSEPAVAGGNQITAERLDSIEKIANEISKG